MPLNDPYSDKRDQRRAPIAFLVAGVLCVAAGAGMIQYDYTKPELAPSNSITVWFWQNVDSLCNLLAYPTVLAGTLLVMFGIVRLAIIDKTH